MATCPKCDMAVREDARRCPLCGTSMGLHVLRPARTLKDDLPLLDPLLDLFVRDEVVRFCPVCLNEHGGERGVCRLCKERVDKAPRSELEGLLRARPILDFGTRVAQGPPSVPPDLVRVRIAKDLPECILCLQELRFVGLDPWPGSDSLDPAGLGAAVGVYVRRQDEEAARFLVGGGRAVEPLTRLKPAPQEGDPDVGAARGYLAIGKYREVLRRLENRVEDPESQRLCSEALLRSGRIREAVARGEQMLARGIPGGSAASPLLAQCALGKALGFDGTPFGRGSDLAAARELLLKAAAGNPRSLMAGQMLVEVMHALGERRETGRQLERLGEVNPNLLAIDGWYRDLHESIRRSRPAAEP